jgi:2,3-bisphosphoglycerate-dependent phosphoglycerate mutase
MTVRIVFETHSTTTANEQGLAAGWLPGELSGTGRKQAQELGRRRAGEDIAAVFCADLRRTAETARIAFGETGIPLLHDWRLRECDYGSESGGPAARMLATRTEHMDVPYPGGESWRQAVCRVGWFLEDLPRRWDGKRVLVVGCIATRWGLEHWLNGVPLTELATEQFVWQAGWEYRLG